MSLACIVPEVADHDALRRLTGASAFVVSHAQVVAELMSKRGPRAGRIRTVVLYGVRAKEKRTSQTSLLK